jgi:hypothetical protein
VTHAIAVEMISGLSAPVELFVADRVPVTDDKAVEIKLIKSEPEAEKYTQDERGRYVRGGLLWKVALPAGGRAEVKFVYRISLPSKSELVGGNRRD